MSGFCFQGFEGTGILAVSPPRGIWRMTAVLTSEGSSYIKTQIVGLRLSLIWEGVHSQCTKPWVYFPAPVRTAMVTHTCSLNTQGVKTGRSEVQRWS